MSTGKPADKGIVELVGRRVLDGLLRNVHSFSDRTKQVQVAHVHAQRCQTRTGRKMTFRGYDRLVHMMGLLSLVVNSSDRSAPSSFFWQVLRSWQHTATNWGQT